VPADSCLPQQFSLTGDQAQVWSVFEATDSTLIVQLDSAGLNTALLSHVILFSGNCAGLNQMDSLTFGSYPSQVVLTGLIPGTEYILCFGRNLLADCPAGVCPEQENVKVCLRERYAQLALNWSNPYYSGFCYGETADPNGNSVLLACTLQVCVNQVLTLEAWEGAVTNNIPVFNATPYSVVWTLPGSNPFSNPVNGPLSVKYSTPGIYPGNYVIQHPSSPSTNFVIEVVDLPAPQNIQFTLSTNVVCPGEFVEIASLYAQNAVFYDVIVFPQVPVNGNIIGPFPAAAVGQCYTVTALAANPCGVVTATETVCIDYQLGFDFIVDCSVLTLESISPCLNAANWTYEYDFGDGSRVVTAPYGSVSHNYLSPGAYTVIMNVEDNTTFPGVFIGTFSQTVLIEGTPQLDFDYTVNCGEVFFENNTRCDEFITSWNWNFGDGTASPFQTPVPNPHVYSSNGTYTVTLTGFHQNGQTYIYQQVIFITNVPVDPIIEGPTRLCCEDLTYNVTNGPYASYIWSFDDPLWNGNIQNNGTSTVSIIPPPEVDEITLCVTVIDQNGCEAETCIFLSNTNCCPEALRDDPENAGSPLVNASDIVVETSYCGETFMSSLLDVNSNPVAPLYDAGGLYVILNHDLVVDVDAKILNAKIRVLGGHTIRVLDGVSFELENCVVQAKCDKLMWKGIVLESTGSQLALDNTLVKHAEKVVISNAGAPFTIISSSFVNNWIGIEVNTLAGVHPGVVSRTSFTTTALLFPPYAGVSEGFAGINLLGVPDIQIGITLPNGGNSFSVLQFGIRGNNSGARIYNNSFNNIGNAASSNTSHKGIYFTSRLIPRQLTVGGFLPQQRNTFTNVNIGVHADSRINTQITRNNFNQVFHYGIWVSRYLSGALGQGSHSIWRNTIFTDQGKIGIWAQDNNNTLIDIQWNEINNYSDFIEQGILVSNTVANTSNPNVLVQVMNNRIRQTWLGIGLINVPRVYAAFNRPQVAVTNADLASTGLSYTGIRMENCLEGELDGNQVSRVGGLPNSPNQLTGIWVESSMMAYVHENTVEGWGKGIHVQDNNLNSRLYCNTLRRDYNGFYFTNAVIGDQGEDAAMNPPAGLASDNRWVANQGADRMDGNLLAVSNWYFRPGGLYFPQQSLAIDNDVSELPLSNQSSSECGAGGGPGGGIRTPGAVIRRQYFQNVATGTSLYSQHTSDHQFWEQSHSHRLFYMDNGWLTVDPVDDSLYQSFYTLEQSGTKGALVQAEIAFTQNDTGNVLFNCNQVVATCNQESLSVQVYELAANKYLNDSVLFDASDSLWLYNLACSEPLTEGAAVFAARSLLGLPFGCLNEQLFRAVEHPITGATVSDNISVYPNPTQGNLTVEADLPIKKLRLYDGLGRLILEQTANGEQIMNLDIASLQPGIYVLEIVGDDIRKVVQVSKQ
jgi:PKD repeat protein